MTRHFSSNLIHLVFATKDRAAWLKGQAKIRFHQFITAVVQKRGHRLLQINGMPDHLHILIEVKTSTAISDLVRIIKSVSTKWAKEEIPGFEGFSWQTGYGAFSVSRSQVRKVIAYIANQEVHHEKQSFHEEFIGFLNKHQIEFEEKWLWK